MREECYKSTKIYDYQKEGDIFRWRGHTCFIAQMMHPLSFLICKTLWPTLRKMGELDKTRTGRFGRDCEEWDTYGCTQGVLWPRWESVCGHWPVQRGLAPIGVRPPQVEEAASCCHVTVTNTSGNRIPQRTSIVSSHKILFVWVTFFWPTRRKYRISARVR